LPFKIAFLKLLLQLNYFLFQHYFTAGRDGKLLLLERMASIISRHIASGPGDILKGRHELLALDDDLPA
jgi:hypothetical protein